MKDTYITITSATTYMDFTVSAEKPSMVIERAGSFGCHKRVEPLAHKGCTARFHIDEPCFGMPDGWYELSIMDGCCPCSTHRVKIDNACQAIYAGSEDTVYAVSNLKGQG